MDVKYLSPEQTQELIGETKRRLGTKQDTIQVSTLPTASVDYVGKVYQYIGVTGNGLTHNYFYECEANTSTTPTTYSWINVNVQEGGSGQSIQYGTMPTAELSRAGDIIQYVGTDTNDYKNGYFYKCVENSGVYSWQAIDVQSGGGGSSVQSDWNQTDSTADDYIKNKPTIPDITGKADKVDGAVNGNFAGLDANGNLTDSGSKATDFATPSDVADEEISATATNTSFSLTDATNGRLQGLTIEGRSTNNNLLEIKHGNGTYHNVTFTNNGDGTFTLNGTVTSGEMLIRIDQPDFAVVNPHNYSAGYYTASGLSTKLTLTIMQENTWLVLFASNSQAQRTWLVSEAKSNCFAFISAPEGTSFNNETFRIMFNKGETALPFEPYGINNVGDNGFGVTSCGKNWLPTDKGSNHSLHTLTATRNADGSVYISGTCTGGPATYYLVGSGWNYASGVKNLLKKNTTYTISGGNVWRQRIEVLAYNSDNTQAEFDSLAPGSSTYEKRTNAATTGYPVFVTPDIDDLSYVIYIRIEENEVVNFTFTPQIELGSTVTSFSPYKGSTASLTTGLPLCSVGDVKDEVDYNRGVVVKRTGKINLKTAEWTNDSQHANVGGFSLPLNNSNNGAISLILSSYPYDNATNFTWGNFDTYNDNTAYKNSGNNVLYIKDTRYTTLENFVAHFGNDDAVVYELAEPYEVPMTAAEVSAYHALRTFEDTTNITATDSPTMTVDYLLDTENGKAVGKVTENLDGRMDLQQLQLNDHEQRIADLEDAMTSMLVGG